eukprot:1731303-Prymnesium_polylepis.2
MPSCPDEWLQQFITTVAPADSGEGIPLMAGWLTWARTGKRRSNSQPMLGGGHVDSGLRDGTATAARVRPYALNIRSAVGHHSCSCRDGGAVVAMAARIAGRWSCNSERVPGAWVPQRTIPKALELYAVTVRNLRSTQAPDQKMRGG